MTLGFSGDFINKRCLIRVQVIGKGSCSEWRVVLFINGFFGINTFDMERENALSLKIMYGASNYLVLLQL